MKIIQNVASEVGTGLSIIHYRAGKLLFFG
jgi:hypothetical protein